MQADLSSVVMAAQTTLRDPRGMARRLMGLNLPQTTSLLGLLLMAVLSALLSAVALRLTPIEADPALAGLFSSPLRILLIQSAVMLVLAMLIHGVGRLAGGVGHLRDAILLTAWMEFVMLLLQMLQLLLMLVAPPLSDVAGFISIVLFFWLLSNFVAELHGFRSIFAVLAGILATVLVMSLALAIVVAGLLGTGL